MKEKHGRSELKYIISGQQYHDLVKILSRFLPRDKNSRNDKGYFVRSLYFDSHNNRSIREKQEGLLFRKKYRMRIYDLSAKEVRFEIKHKIGDRIFKEITTISKESALKAINGNYVDLLGYNDDILNRIYAKFTLGNYKPKLTLDYQREVFCSDLLNIRITIDSNICASRTNFNIFSSNLNTTPLMLDNKYLLEIKFNKILPDHLRKILQINSFEKTDFSKYLIGRKHE